METPLLFICTNVLLLAISLLAKVLGYVLTEVWPIPIPVKPFTCWGCLSFWFTFSMGTAAALLLYPYYTNQDAGFAVTAGAVVASVLYGLVNYFYIKSKYLIYEKD